LNASRKHPAAIAMSAAITNVLTVGNTHLGTRFNSGFACFARTSFAVSISTPVNNTFEASIFVSKHRPSRLIN
jgi:hypothetical protein